jgi:8-hydroxy-5-deazaflavin:NADPH oxidoreductase
MISQHSIEIGPGLVGKTLRRHIRLQQRCRRRGPSTIARYRSDLDRLSRRGRSDSCNRTPTCCCAISLTIGVKYQSSATPPVAKRAAGRRTTIDMEESTHENRLHRRRQRRNTIGRHLLIAGHQIVLSNTRSPESLSALVEELGEGAEAGAKEDAMNCDVVVLATHWVHVWQALEGLTWRGQILIDATNAHEKMPADFSAAGIPRSIAAHGDKTSSEIVAEPAPRARVVKAFSNIPMRWIQDFSKEKPRTVIFVASDHPDPKDVVISLINDIGFVPVYTGNLAAGRIHQVGAPLSGLDLNLVQRLR